MLQNVAVEYLFYKLIAPRPTFPADMDAEEAALMNEHADYWRHLVHQRHVLVFGPVVDPASVFGVAILRVQDGSVAQLFAEGDPAITANRGFRFELHQMPHAISAYDLPTE